MSETSSTRECAWCYSRADWRAQTARGPVDVCQRHYDALQADMRADRLASLSCASVALINEFRTVNA